MLCTSIASAEIMSKQSNNPKGNNERTVASSPQYSALEHSDLAYHVLDALTNLTYLFDLTEQRYLFISSLVHAMTGYTADEVYEMKDQAVVHLLHPDDLPRCEAHLKNMISAGTGQIFEIDYRLRLKEGGWIWLRSRDRIFKTDENGNPLQTLGAAIDISDYKRREANMAFLNNVLDECSRYTATQDIIQSAGKRIGQYLNVQYCHFMAIDEPQDMVIFLDRWHAPDVPPLPDTVVLSEHVSDTFYEMVRAGKPVVSENVYTNSITKSEANAEIGVGAFITVPFHHQGEWKFLFSVHDTQARQWREDEVDLVCDLAGRLFPRLERARAETALRETEERFYKAFNASPMALTITSLTTGKLVSVNETFERVTGYSREEAVGKTTVELGLWRRPTDREAELQLVQHAGQVVNTEYVFRVKSGTEIIGLLSAERIEIGGQPFALTVIQDISERKRREAHLAFLDSLTGFLIFSTVPSDIVQRFGEKMHELTGASVCAFVEIDPNKERTIIFDEWKTSGTSSLKQEYHLSEYVTEEFQKRMSAGHPVVVRDVREDIHIKNKDRFLELNIGAFLNIPLIRNEEWAFSLGIYHEQPYDWQEDEIALTVEASNRMWNKIERARAENALAQTGERLQLALDATEMGTFIWHIPENRSELDARMLELFGLPAEGIRHFTDAITQAIHPDDLVRYSEAVARACHTSGHGKLDIDLRVVYADGQNRWLTLSGQVYFSGNPRQALHMVGAAIDITPVKAFEAHLEALVEERTAELRESNRQLEATNKELEQFAFVTSHDLQEPLRKIQSFSGLLKSRSMSELDASSQLYLDKIMTAAGRMRDLIHDLLQFARLGHRKEPFERVNLNAEIAKVLETYDLLIAEKEAVIDIDPLPEIEAAPWQLNLLFTNLISNALKFNKPDVSPHIHISSRPLTNQELAREALNQDWPYVEISVHDNGIGFHPEHAERIFGIFQRLHGVSDYLGTGIGLSICSKVTMAHHGKIFARGVPGDGAVFTIWLPVSRGDK